MGAGSGSAAEQDSYETGHLEVKVSWSESLAEHLWHWRWDLLALFSACIFQLKKLSGRLGSLKTESNLILSLSQLSHVSWTRSVLGIFALIYAVRRDGSGH